MKRKKRPIKDMPREISAALIAVGAAFFLGGVLGCVLARQVGSGGADSLLQYIQRYLSAAQTDGAPSPALLTLIWEAVRFPLLAFILGFTALGLIGTPLLFFARGFLLSFAVTSFVCMFGAAGGILAFLLLGVTGVVTIPPLFVLGTQGMAASRALLRRYLGARREGTVYSRRYFLRCGGCAAVIAICILFDYFAAPVLVRLVAGIL